MDESTRVILNRRLAELERVSEISDKNVDKIIQIIAMKTPGKEPEDIQRKADVVKANTARLKFRNEMIKGFRESMVRSMRTAVA
jgi:hypothetical protein